MEKKILCVIVAAVAIFTIAGVLYYKSVVSDNETDAGNDEQVQNQDVEVNETISDGDIVEIPIDSVKGITPTRAEELCYSVFGEKDEETGFIFSFGTSAAVETAGKQYYVIRASWLVDNSHMSYIGDFFVSADGKELYGGTALQGEYIIDDLIWSE